MTPSAQAAPYNSGVDPITGQAVSTDTVYQSIASGTGETIVITPTTLGAGGSADFPDAIATIDNYADLDTDGNPKGAYGADANHRLNVGDPLYSGAVEGNVIFQRWGNSNLGRENDQTIERAKESKSQPITMQGVRVYAQYQKTCGPHKGFVSKVYTDVTDANGAYHINMGDEVTTGGVVGFSADPTSSGGCEKWKIWAENPDQARFRMLMSPAYGQFFPKAIVSDTTYSLQDLDIAGEIGGDDTIHHTKIAFGEHIDNQAMHLTDENGNIDALEVNDRMEGGYVHGSVGWNFSYTQGVLTWGPQILLAFDTTMDTPAPDVTVYGSYLSDYAVCKIHSDGLAYLKQTHQYQALNGGTINAQYPGTRIRYDDAWNNTWEARLQNWIKNQIAAEDANPTPVPATDNCYSYWDGSATGQRKWIAETSKTKVLINTPGANGEYTLHFRGTYGYSWETGLPGQPKAEELGLWHTLAQKPEDAGYGPDCKLNAPAEYQGHWANVAPNYTLDAIAAGDGCGETGLPVHGFAKHINGDWLFVSIEDTANAAVATPMHANWYGSLYNEVAYGNNETAGWVGTAWDDQGDSTKRMDFSMFPGSPIFYTTPYNNDTNLAMAGEVQHTVAEGLPSKYLDNVYFTIVWTDDTGKEVKRCGPQHANSGDGTLPDCPFMVPQDLDRDTQYTATLYPTDSAGRWETAIGADSFTAVPVVPPWMSKYDTYTNDSTWKNAAGQTQKGYRITPEKMGINASSGTTPIHNVTFAKWNGTSFDAPKNTVDWIEGLSVDTSTMNVVGTPTKTGRWPVQVSFERWINAAGNPVNPAGGCKLTDDPKCYTIPYSYVTYIVVTDDPVPDGTTGEEYEFDVASYLNDAIKGKDYHGEKCAGDITADACNTEAVRNDDTGAPENFTGGATWKLVAVDSIELGQDLKDAQLYIEKDPDTGESTSTIKGVPNRKVYANQLAGTCDLDPATNQPVPGSGTIDAATGAVNPATCTNGPNVTITYTVKKVDANGNDMLDNAGNVITKQHTDRVPLRITGESIAAQIGGHKALEGNRAPNAQPVWTATLNASGATSTWDDTVPSCRSGATDPTWRTGGFVNWNMATKARLGTNCPNPYGNYEIEVASNNASAVINTDGSIDVTPQTHSQGEDIVLKVWRRGEAVEQRDGQFRFTLTFDGNSTAMNTGGQDSFSVSSNSYAYNSWSDGFDAEGYFDRDPEDFQPNYNMDGKPQAEADWDGENGHASGYITVTTVKDPDDGSKGTFLFPSPTFTKAGVYHFTVTEEDLGENLVTYATKSYDLIVLVTGDDVLGYQQNMFYAPAFENLVAQCNTYGIQSHFHLNNRALFDPTKFGGTVAGNYRETLTTDQAVTPEIFDTAFSEAVRDCFGKKNGVNVLYPQFETGTLDFTNRYDTSAGSQIFEGSKTLKNDAADDPAQTVRVQEDDQFSFTLAWGAKDEQGNAYTSFGVNDAGNSFVTSETATGFGFDTAGYFADASDADSEAAKNLRAQGFNGTNQPAATPNVTAKTMTVTSYLDPADPTNKTGKFAFPRLDFKAQGVYYFTVTEAELDVNGAVSPQGVIHTDATSYPLAVYVTGNATDGYSVAKVLRPQLAANASGANATTWEAAGIAAPDSAATAVFKQLGDKGDLSFVNIFTELDLPPLPLTGGLGAYLFWIYGGVVLGAALGAVAYTARRRRQLAFAGSASSITGKGGGA